MGGLPFRKAHGRYSLPCALLHYASRLNLGVRPQERFMRFTIFFLLLAISPVTSAGEEDFNLTTEALEHSSTEIVLAGGLRYCGNPGLSKTIFQLASDKWVANMLAVGRSGDVHRVGKRVIQAADEHADGVRVGLALANIDSSRRAAICNELVGLADNLLQQSWP